MTGNTHRGNASCMKVTVKGQVTIPIALPERFGLNPGTAVKFVATDGGLRMKPRKRGGKTASAFDHWLAKAAGSARKAVTTDEIMAQTRGEESLSVPMRKRKDLCCSHGKHHATRRISQR